MLSPAALGITSSQLYTRSRSPVSAFQAYDPNNTGTVTLEDARKALKELGVKLNLTESKALAMSQVNGDRGIPLSSMTLKYGPFLEAVGATSTRAKDAEGPHSDALRGVSVPSSGKDVAYNMVSRLVQERGTDGEGYKAGLANPMAPHQKEYAGRHVSQLDTVGGLKTFLSEDEPTPAPRPVKNIHQGGEFTTTGIGSFIEEPTVGGPGAATQRKPDALQFGVLDKGGIGAFVNVAPRAGETQGLHFPPAALDPKGRSGTFTHQHGKLSSAGGVASFVAVESMLDPPQPPPKKASDSAFHAGEISTSGIAAFIHDGIGGAPSGGTLIGGAGTTAHFHPALGAPGARNDVLFTHSSFSGMADSHPGLARAVDEGLLAGEVPVLGRGEGGDDGGGFGGGTGGAPSSSLFDSVHPPPRPTYPHYSLGAVRGAVTPSAHMAATPTATTAPGELAAAGGLSGHVMTLAPGAPQPRGGDLLVRPYPGHLTAAGGLAGYQTRPTVFRPAADRHIPGPPSSLDTADGGLPGFLAGESLQHQHQHQQTQAFDVGAVALGGLGHLSHHTPGPVGELDASQGISHFYGASGEGLGAGETQALLPPTRRLAHHPQGHKPGRLEDANGGLAGYLARPTPPPPGALYTINPNNPSEFFHHHEVPVHSGNRGALDRLGGIYGLHAAGPAPDAPPTNRGELQAMHSISSLSHVSLQQQVARGAGGGGGGKPPTGAAAATAAQGGGGSALEQLANAALYEHEEAAPSGGGAGAGASAAASAAAAAATEQYYQQQLQLQHQQHQQQLQLQQHQHQHQLQLQLQQQQQQQAPQTPTSAAFAASLNGSYFEPSTPSNAAARGRTPLYPAPTPSTAAAAEALGSLSMASLEGINGNGGGGGGGGGGAPATPSSASTPSRWGSASAASGVPAAEGFDLRRLARVRKAIRDILPKKGSSAAAVLRARLHKEDGDGDGVVSDVELLRGLYSITPGLIPSDCNFLIKYLSKRFSTGVGGELGPHVDTLSRGTIQGISSKEVAEWFVAQPGGMGRGMMRGGGEEEEGAAPEEEEEEEGGGGDRLGAKAQRFAQFRAGWEERHGAPARKEMAWDAGEKAEGPTWTRAEPVPFKVVHLAQPAPPSASKRGGY